MRFFSLLRPSTLFSTVALSAVLFPCMDLALAQANQEQRLVSSDVALDDRFGHDVAVDTTRLIAGAPGQDSVASNAGAAYVFDFDGGASQWMESGKITAANGEADDGFGGAVDVLADRVAIGSSGQDGASGDEGSVYLYTWDSGTTSWILEDELFAPIPAVGDALGSSVLLGSDLLIAGAPSSSNAGTVHVFRFDSGLSSWSHEAALQASDAAVGDLFGSSISLDGDLLVVGAPGHGSGEGALYLIEYNAGAGSWSEIDKLEASDKGTSSTPANLGVSVDLVGEQLVAGASGFTVGVETESGKSYLFERDGGTGIWSETQGLLPQNSWTGGNFGNDIRINGPKIQVGNPFAGNILEGIVHGLRWHADDLAYRQLEEWTSLYAIPNSSSFGYSLDTSTEGKLVIGTPTEVSTPGSQEGGSVYVYFFPEFQLTLSPNQAGVVNTLSCVGATPKSGVAFVYGFSAGFTSLQVICPGIGFEIQGAVLIDRVNADGVGQAAVSQMIPGGASGFTILLQAFDVRGCRVSEVLNTTLQ